MKGPPKTPEDFNPLDEIPKPILAWAEKKGLAQKLARYGWEICEVCGRLGIAWATDWLPTGKNLEFEETHRGWMHPPAFVCENDFFIYWDDVKDHPEKLGNNEMSDLFDKYMRALVNGWEISDRRLQHGPGQANPWPFCISAYGGFGTRTRGRLICPKCGEPGTGFGKTHTGQNRFFHGSDRSCYLGMVEPKRVKGPETTCPKCGKRGHESTSKGYRYFRHKDCTCYVGKVSDETHITASEVVRKSDSPDSNEITCCYVKTVRTRSDPNLPDPNSVVKCDSCVECESYADMQTRRGEDPYDEFGEDVYCGFCGGMV